MKNILEQDFKLHAGSFTEKVQEHAHKLGYDFLERERQIIPAARFLYFRADGRAISFGVDLQHFIEASVVEITLAEFFALEPKPKEEVTFKTFDPVIVRKGSNTKWCAAMFSHYDSELINPFVTEAGEWKFCLRANEGNLELVGTTHGLPKL